MGLVMNRIQVNFNLAARAARYPQDESLPHISASLLRKLACLQQSSCKGHHGLQRGGRTGVQPEAAQNSSRI